MKKLSLRFLTLILMGIMMYSCQKDDEILSQTPNRLRSEGAIKLGKKLENPYSVENMRKALANLKKSSLSAKFSIDKSEITATHLYIKFKPKNEKELSILKADSTLVLYDYPLDYVIQENGAFYKDPETTGEQPTYQYCSIRVDKKLPIAVEAEILAELFIPDEDSNNTPSNSKSGKSFSTEIVDALVDEALRITDNLEEKTKSKSSHTGKVTASQWRPAGTIKSWDDNFGSEGEYVGVEGVKVRARRWFTTHTGITDATGKYSCDGRFKRDANYSIDWERYDFALQDGWLNGATYNGPKQDGDWNLDLKDTDQEYYATIFRAAYHYYYKDIKGLRRPPENSFWKTQLKIKASLNDKEDLGVHIGFWRSFGLYSAISIYTRDRSNVETYATTIHELAHASHWSRESSVFFNFNGIDDKVKESWARGVQWELTRMVYPTYLGREFRTDDYTLVVADMIDNDFATTEARTNQGYYRNTNDQVFGYTIKQLEDALDGTKTWNGWRDNIIAKYTNPTEDNLTNLFKNYE